MQQSIRMAIATLIVFTAQGAFPDEPGTRAEQKIAEIDQMSQETLDRLFSTYPYSKELFELSYGYAIFDNVKVMFGVSGGGGKGVAVTRGTNDRIYMKMGSGGIGFGLGGQRYRLVMFFEDRTTFENFVYKGWQGNASANAVAGTAGANAASGFTQGVVIYKLTEAGLMLKADVSATRFKVDKKLNRIDPVDSRAATAEYDETYDTYDPNERALVETEPLEPRE